MEFIPADWSIDCISYTRQSFEGGERMITLYSIWMSDWNINACKQQMNSWKGQTKQHMEIYTAETLSQVFQATLNNGTTPV